MSELTTFVGPKPAAEKMARSRALPGVAERSARVREEMAEADRVYAESLAEVRRAADLTHVALATQMGVVQTVISSLERQHDMLLSTLTGYLQAAGEHPRIVVTVYGQDVELDLAALVSVTVLAPLLPLPHNQPTPATAGRGKGGPEAQPEGPRSALPPTKAAGMLRRLGGGERIGRVGAARALFRRGGRRDGHRGQHAGLQ